MKCTFLDEARHEVDTAAEWYDTQRGGLGLQFVSEIENAVAAICEQPELTPELFDGIRKRKTDRFPFSFSTDSGKMRCRLSQWHTPAADPVIGWDAWAYRIF